MMSVMKQASARRAEKALKEILDKADDNANGRVSGDIVLLFFYSVVVILIFLFLLVKTKALLWEALIKQLLYFLKPIYLPEEQ